MAETQEELATARARTLGFGQHRGKSLAGVPPDYVAWLAGAKPPARRSGAKSAFKVPDGLREAALLVHAANEAAREGQQLLRRMLSGQVHQEGGYVIERLGDLKGLTGHNSLDEALEHLSGEFPPSEDGWRGPDPEDDRILIWEVLPSGHKKVVWHFSGWHWDADEFGLPQGKLPGDERSLYDLSDSG